MPLGFDRSGGRARLAESPLMHAPLVSLVPRGAMSFRVHHVFPGCMVDMKFCVLCRGHE